MFVRLFFDIFCLRVFERCQELIDWYVEYESCLKWCNDADEKVKERKQPGEYITLVERQHRQIEVKLLHFSWHFKSFRQLSLITHSCLIYFMDVLNETFVILDT